MILKGSQRSGGKALAAHLLNEADNEHIELHDLRGFSADDLTGAFKEVEAISKGTRCTQYLFSLSLSPPQSEDVPIEHFEAAIKRIEQKLGLEDQPRAIVFHEKEGRRHAHCIWSRIDSDTMKAIELPFFKNRLCEISRQLYLEHGWDMPRGFKDTRERNPFNFTLAEWQQAKRHGEDPKELKALLHECWASADNKQAFTRALEDRGFTLCAGDKRGYVAMDFRGEVYSLTRWLDVKTKELAARLGDAASLPSVATAKENLAKRMTKTIEKHEKTVKEQLQREAAPLLKQRRDMQEQHREERESQKAFHEKRQAFENRQRAEQLPKGLKAVWYFLSGRYFKDRTQFEKEKKAGLERDRAEKNALIQAQLKERRTLQLSLMGLRQDHKAALNNLREDTAYYLRLGRQQQELPRAEFQKAGDRMQTQGRDTDTGKNRDKGLQ